MLPNDLNMIVMVSNDFLNVFDRKQLDYGWNRAVFFLPNIFFLYYVYAPFSNSFCFASDLACLELGRIIALL